MKKADALSCASTSERWKMPLTAATSGSTSEVMKPQAKNRQVTTTKALVTLAFRLCCTLVPFTTGAKGGSEKSVAQGGTLALTRRRDEARRASGGETVGTDRAAAAVRRQRRPQGRRIVVRWPGRRAAACEIHFHVRAAVDPGPSGRRASTGPGPRPRQERMLDHYRCGAGGRDRPRAGAGGGCRRASRSCARRVDRAAARLAARCGG